jgi:uncharacterized damage-inducible protein DinB
MNTECTRIADQLRRAYEGKAWHGPSIKDLLTDVTAEQAIKRPVAGAHSVWELVSHIEVWTRAGAEAVKGVPMPHTEIIGTAEDWPPVTGASAEMWSKALDRLFLTGRQLSQAIEQFTDERLEEPVPGRKYNYYYLFHGIVQHTLYHAGQIAFLKK